MAGTPTLRCSVAYALPDRQYLWRVELPAGATLADAIAAARSSALRADPEHLAAIPWETAPVGVFGEARPRSCMLADGDRVELYRPLAADPRERRRERLRSARR